MKRARRAAMLLGVCVAARLSAHEGPPYPIVSDAMVGAYRVSIWTDPDVSDDPKAVVGKFWVLVHRPSDGTPVGDARVAVAVEAETPPGEKHRAEAIRDARELSRYFATLRLDREGPWLVTAFIDGPFGSETTTAPVEATYDIRPARGMIFLFLFPFVVVGSLWVLALRRRRHAARRR